MSLTLSYLLRKVLVISIWIIAIFGLLLSTNLENKFKKDKNTLYIFTWSDVLSNDFLKEFEKETGINVKIDYYSSNEELIIKLKKIRNSGYDLVVPSDYAVPLLAREGLLKKIDKTKLEFYNQLNPKLLGFEYDPNNTYSIPYQWDIGGFGIDKDFFKEKSDLPFTWDNLFNENVIDYKIAMTNDPIEAFTLASYYLFGNKTELKDLEAKKVEELLKTQKKSVEAYAVPRSDYVLGSKNAALAFSLSAYILRSQEYFPFIKFVLPEKHTTISIENISIPAGNQNEENIYKFINFLYRKENISKACNDFGVFPSTLDSTDLLKYKEDFLEIQEKISDKNYELFFCKHLLSDQKLRELWVKIKS